MDIGDIEAPEQRSHPFSVAAHAWFLTYGVLMPRICSHGLQLCGPHSHWTDGLKLDWICAELSCTIECKFQTLAVLPALLKPQLRPFSTGVRQWDLEPRDIYHHTHKTLSFSMPVLENSFSQDIVRTHPLPPSGRRDSPTCSSNRENPLPQFSKNNSTSIINIF